MVCIGTDERMPLRVSLDVVLSLNEARSGFRESFVRSLVVIMLRRHRESESWYFQRLQTLRLTSMLITAIPCPMLMLPLCQGLVVDKHREGRMNKRVPLSSHPDVSNLPGLTWNERI